MMDDGFAKNEVIFLLSNWSSIWSTFVLTRAISAISKAQSCQSNSLIQIWLQNLFHWVGLVAGMNKPTTEGWIHPQHRNQFNWLIQKTLPPYQHTSQSPRLNVQLIAPIMVSRNLMAGHKGQFVNNWLKFPFQHCSCFESDKNPSFWSSFNLTKMLRMRTAEVSPKGEGFRKARTWLVLTCLWIGAIALLNELNEL